MFKSDGYPKIEKSKALYERATGLIPAYTQTLAKGPEQHVFGSMPIYAARGNGARITDVDGNEFLDFQMGIGPLSLGYCYPAVDQAIRRQLEEGITFSLMHPLEVEVAELIRTMVPHVESVRYSKTGADVTSAAVRVARAFTGRNKILCCGYHGWDDWYISVTDRISGIPSPVRELTSTFDTNRLDQVEDSIDEDTAAIILEPMVFEKPKPGFLEGLRQICDRNGTLLIFDEMWTGFRIAPGGAQEKFNVRADLMTFSKAIANGMPISVLAGRQDVMKVLEQKVFFFTTFGGEALSLAAAKATMNEIREKKVCDYLDALGGELVRKFEALTCELDFPMAKILGMNARTMMSVNQPGEDGLAVKSYVQQELGRRGILWSGFHNLSYSHKSSDIDCLMGAYSEVFQSLKELFVTPGKVEAQLRGRKVSPVFRKTSQFNMKPKTPGGRS